MPVETNDALSWSLKQKNDFGENITAESNHDLVDKVRQYFNDNGIKYSSFSYSDLEPYLN